MFSNYEKHVILLLNSKQNKEENFSEMERGETETETEQPKDTITELNTAQRTRKKKKKLSTMSHLYFRRTHEQHKSNKTIHPR